MPGKMFLLLNTFWHYAIKQFELCVLAFWLQSCTRRHKYKPAHTPTSRPVIVPNGIGQLSLNWLRTLVQIESVIYGA